MRKKLDTRFPAARIKKIMQADDEVGKIAMATPVLISKALELFLQDLCDRTYDITLKRGAKTMNSHHLKECVHSHSVFDFLRESVSRIPDLDPESAGGESGRRRKAVDCDNDESGDEETKQPKSCEGPAKGRSRRGKKRRNSNGQNMESSEPMMDKPDDNGATSSSPQLSDDCHGNSSSSSPKARLQQHADDASSYLAQTSRAAAMDSAGNGPFPKDFDLNMGLDENGEVNDAKPNSMPEPEAKAEPEPELEVGNQSPWAGPGPSSFLYHGHNAFQLAEEEEDYDCEDEEEG